MSMINASKTNNITYPSTPFSTIVEAPDRDDISPMYKIHKYWARKPWYTVSEYIKYFTREGESVLDPFCGSGVTGIEAIAHGRKAVLVDLNPIATFVSRVTAIVDIDFYKLRSEFSRIAVECEEKIQNLYWLDQTCSLCGGQLETRHVLRGPGFPDPIVQARCPDCGIKVQNVRRELTAKELEYLQKVESSSPDEWYPATPFPEKFDKDRITYKGIKRVDQIFTVRNLKALAWIRESIERVQDKKIQDLLKLAFSNTLLHVSKLKAENVRPMAVNNYWVPDDWIEENVWYRFKERYQVLTKGKKVSCSRIAKSAYEKLEIHTGSATNLSMLDDDSIDYVFTDPPYGNSIQYSELSRIWNAWLNEDFPIEDEVIINPAQSKGHDEYETILAKAFREMYRVLKSGRWLTLCFHNKEFATWNAILSACREAGFVYANALPQDPLSQSFTQAWAENSPRTDLLINLYKPNGGTIKVRADKTREKSPSLSSLVAAVCSDLPMQEAQNPSVVYDQVILKLVEHAFYSSEPLNANDYSIYKVRHALKEIIAES